MEPSEKLQQTFGLLKNSAQLLGFADLRVAPAVESQGFSRLVQWIEAGYAGQMDYFQNRLDAYRHPEGVLEGVKSLVMLTYPYPAVSSSLYPEQVVARTARYTWIGKDYHDVLHDKLKTLANSLRECFPECKVRGVVDTAPLMEREFAELAGLGWRGKNTLLINKYAGSYFFLACLLTDLEFPIDSPHETNHCGTCRRCLDACPTDAFPQPGVLDASRCISYLTIEHRGEIPPELRVGVGEWVFGCDVCQEVCPWNRPKRLEKFGHKHSEPEQSSESQIGLGPELSEQDVASLFHLDDEAFRKRFRKTPMWRVKRRGLLRNAAIVLGNCQHASGIPALEKGLDDEESLVRSSCAWALKKIGGEQSARILEARRAKERDPAVLSELDAGAYTPKNQYSSELNN